MHEECASSFPSPALAPATQISWRRLPKGVQLRESDYRSYHASLPDAPRDLVSTLPAPASVRLSSAHYTGLNTLEGKRVVGWVGWGWSGGGVRREEGVRGAVRMFWHAPSDVNCMNVLKLRYRATGDKVQVQG